MFLQIYATSLDPIVKWLGEWLAEINFASISIRLFIALLIGGFLGLDRSNKKQPAGLRTYILVCVGSTIAAMTNQFMSQVYGADASRIGANIITGIGFLGAGTIIVTSRSKIRGLTTAAGLWCCACVGLAIGIGFYSIAILGSLLIYIALKLLPLLEKALINKTKYVDLHIEFDYRTNLKDFIKLLRSEGVKIISVDLNPSYSQSGLSVYEITIQLATKTLTKDCKKMIEEWSKLEYVEWIERV